MAVKQFLPVLVLVISIGVLESGRGPWALARAPQPARPAGKDHDYEMTAAAGVKVRLLNLPREFDDKGRIKEYTEEELKQLKGADPGDQDLPGFKSAFAALRKGDVVQVSLSAPKANGDRKTVGTEEKDQPTWVAAGQLSGTITHAADKSLTVRVSNDRSPSDAKTVLDPGQKQATMIVIQQRGPGDDGQRKRKRGKN